MLIRNILNLSKKGYPFLRRYRRVVVACAVFIFLLFGLRGFIVRELIKNYCKKHYGAQVRIGPCRVGVYRVTADNFFLENDDFQAHAERVGCSFSFFPPRVVKVGLFGTVLNVKKPHFLSQLFSGRGIGESEFGKIRFDLIDCQINAADLDGANIRLGFLARGIISSGSLSVKDFKVKRCDLSFGCFTVRNLRILPVGTIHYVLIDSVKIRDKETRNVEFPIVIADKQLVFLKSQNSLFGPDAVWGGRLVFNTFSDIHGMFVVNGASLANFAGIFAVQKELAAAGRFDGSVKFAVTNGELSVLDCLFGGRRGGFINIKKEAALDLLKQYLDRRSYKLFIDSLNDYQYNESIISLEKQLDGITLEFDFNSDRRGERKLLFVFHGTGGVSCTVSLPKKKAWVFW